MNRRDLFKRIGAVIGIAALGSRFSGGGIVPGAAVAPLPPLPGETIIPALASNAPMQGNESISIEEIEKALEYAWTSYRVAPAHIDMSAGEARSLGFDVALEIQDGQWVCISRSAIKPKRRRAARARRR